MPGAVDIALDKRGQNNHLFCVFPQVQISVQSLRCHADTIRLQITSCKPYKTSELELAQSSHICKTNLIKEVTKTVEEAQLAYDRAKTKVIHEEYEEYRQTQGASLYRLLEEIKDLALLDVSADSGA